MADKGELAEVENKAEKVAEVATQAAEGETNAKDKAEEKAIATEAKDVAQKISKARSGETPPISEASAQVLIQKMDSLIDRLSFLGERKKKEEPKTGGFWSRTFRKHF